MKHNPDDSTKLYKDESTNHSPPQIPFSEEEYSMKTLGQYNLISELGHGAAGKVYLAWNRELHRYCAIKILTLEQDHQLSELIERFRSEGKYAAGLIHPHIVATHNLGVFEDEHFMEMEFVPWWFTFGPHRP